MSASTVIPEGWMVEREDRSVGIFGDVYYHDGCPTDWSTTPEGWFDAEVTETLIGHRGEGWGRVMVIRYDLTCQACGATTFFVLDEYDPDDSEDEGWVRGWMG